MKLNEDVSYITLHSPLSLPFHGYVWPFMLAYSILVGTWLSWYGLEASPELFFLCLAAIAGLNIIACLSCIWSVHIRCLLTCRKVKGLDEASQVKVVPTPNNGYPELVNLVKQKHKVTREEMVWFIFQKTKYIYQDGQFRALEFPISQQYKDYHSWRGYKDTAAINAADQLYGKNKLDMTLPDFWSLFLERATAPFFVFQVFCVGLWCLDEFWYYSLFTLAMLITFEVILVKQQQRNLSEIRKMGAQPFSIPVFREGKWCRMSTDKLLPGDLVSIGRSKSGDLVPCDLLLLKGSCIVDEAMLTGESVPQMKEPLSSIDESLDLSRDSRLHILNGGTKIVQHTPPPKTDRDQTRPQDNGCLGYVLRTGFNTNQGKLLRTILFGVKRVTANNLETFMFIMFLLVFAIAAASYVWIYGTVNPKRNRYKLFLECTLILTSVVPPELPIELSLAVNTSLIALTKIGIFCTEPFRIPFAGKIDVCCFDKTGTLTSDNLIVQGVAGVQGVPSSVDPEPSASDVVPASDSPYETQCVLASCQSLTLLDGEVVGDPLEKACLSAINWTINKGDTVSSRKGKRGPLKICQRFHFSSALKRMSTICSAQGGNHMITVKGAPEVMGSMFSSLPAGYEALYTKLARQGARVLALGYRNLGNISQREVFSLKREDVEKELTFAGLVVISCPLKEDSKRNVRCLHDSSHHVVMVTGDNPLTACHVAKELKITNRKVLIFTADDEGWVWLSVGRSKRVSVETPPAELGEQYDLCLAGNSLSYLLLPENKALFHSLLPYVKVFARVAPKQKESVVTTYKALGYVTLMCGDGTNDVGALKHADVGVALLSTVAMSKKEPAAESSNAELARKPIRSPPKEPSKPLTPQQQREKRLKELMAQMNEADPQLVRLGDASIASPFTSKHSSISCICHVIKQGRCTLVTTLQMFKILALNALILAYSQSVLYLDGIKFSDFQATLQGLLLAGCFLCISRSKPLGSLSKERPLATIFNPYMILTVIVQFIIHFSSLVYIVQESKDHFGSNNSEEVDLEKDFEQNELNSAVYLISMAMQIANFAVNYKGHPFMASLSENKPLLISILVSGGVVLTIASGLLPDLSAMFEIVSFSAEFRGKLLLVLAADFLLSLVTDRALSWLLGYARPKLPK